VHKLLDYYTVVAEREAGFWTSIPLATGRSVAREEWLQMMDADPEHFQLVTITAEELTEYSLAQDDLIECAVFVTWSNEQLQ